MRLLLVFVVIAGCGEGGTGRPTCNPGRICIDAGPGDGDADADADADGDGDLDCPVDSDLDTFVDSRCTGGDDCNDEDPLAHPGGVEVCNGIDDDCVGGIDDGLLEAGEDVVLPQDGVTHLISLAAGANGFGLMTLVAGDTFCEGGRTLSFQELRPDGTPSGEPVLVSESPECRYDHTLSVAALPDGWIMAWADAPPPLGPSSGLDGVIQVATVSGSTLTGPVDIGDRAARGDFTPVLATSPGGTLLVWNHDQEEILYVLLDPTDLSEIASGYLGQGPGVGGRPSVAWTGDGFLVASEIDGADETVVVPVSADGNAGVAISMGFNRYDAPFLAWNGFEAVFSQLDGGQQELYRLDARGQGSTPPVVIAAGGKAQRLAGWTGAFALTANVSPDALNLRGTFTFWILAADGSVSNEIEPDDTSHADSVDPWAVPTGVAGSWAVAWIGVDRDVRVDFVACPD